MYVCMTLCKANGEQSRAAWVYFETYSVVPNVTNSSAIDQRPLHPRHSERQELKRSFRGLLSQLSHTLQTVTSFDCEELSRVFKTLLRELSPEVIQYVPKSYLLLISTRETQSPLQNTSKRVIPYYSRHPCSKPNTHWTTRLWLGIDPNIICLKLE